MFEASFRRIAKFSAKHSTAVIIAWIVAVLVVAPSSTLFLSNTSYDLGGSIVPANSMAQKASDLQSKYFSSSDGTGSNGSALLIVTNNTDVSNSAGATALITLQNKISAYLGTVPGYQNMTTAFTLENSTLNNFSKSLKLELNSTYSLISSISDQIPVAYDNISTGVNDSISFMYGLPALYLNVLNITNNPSKAYNSTISNASGNNFTEAYAASFISYWNSSYFSNPYQDPIKVMNSSIDFALHNQSGSPFYAIINSSGNEQQKSLLYSIQDNYSFSSFLGNDSLWPYLHNYTLMTLQQQLSTNSTLDSFLNDSLNISVNRFVSDVYGLGDPATGKEVSIYSISLVENGTKHVLSGNPEITYNPTTLYGYLNLLNSTDNVSTTVNEIMNSESFSTYPVVPTPFVYHQFVGYDNSTTIMIATFSDNYSLNVVNTVTDISNNYSSSGLLPDSHYYVAGTSALDQQLNNEILGGMIRALVIGITLSILIVGLFFRSPVAAFIPLSVFGMSTVLSMGLNGLLYKYVFHTSISFITPTLLLILILGLTSDYVVYIMSRYRQEKRRQSPTAIFDTGQWAGHAVFTSGITVALSYLVLWASNIPIFSDSGLTNAIGVGISIALANTFLIALLAKTGTKLYWPSDITHAEKFPLERSMTKISEVVRQNRKKILVVFLAVSFLASYLYLITPTSMNVFDLVPKSSGIQALEVVNNSFNGDFFDRGFVVMNFSSPIVVDGKYNMTEVNQVTSVEMSLMNRSEITQVYGPTFPFGTYVPANLTGVPTSYRSTYTNQTMTFIGNDSHYATVDFQLATVSWRNQASDFITSLPSIIDSALNRTESSANSVMPSYYIGGLTQSLNDAHTYTQSTFVKIVPVLLIAIFVVLLVQLSSLFTPARLIAMVVSSVLVALSVVFLIIFYGRGEPILIFLPLFTFITLLAVGLDYDIFMVTRVREEVLRGRGDEDATMISIRENGGVIVTLGMLLFVTFGALYTSGIGIMQEIGLGLALGVIVDTFVSWPFFVPTIMMLLKKWNWWPSKMRMEKE